MAVDLKLEVYNSSLEMQGVLQVVKSVIWEEQAFKAGSFQIEAAYNEETWALLQPDYIVWIADDTAGVIEHIDEKSDESGAFITVKGRLLSCLLGRRVLWGTYKYYGYPATIMSALVSECCVSPTRGTVASRIIPIISLGAVPEGATKIRLQATGKNLLEKLEELGESNQVAYKLSFDAETFEAVFTTYYGVDRTTSQDDVDPVFFSTELDDVLSSAYSYDSSEYCNVAYIGGQVDEETQARAYTTIEGTDTGVNRREIFVDARDLSDVVYENGVEVYLTDSAYEEMLQNRGREKLADCQVAKSFEVSVRTLNPTYEYGVDFFLGDNITLIDERLNLSIDAVVTAVQRSISEQGEQMVFTFGYSQPTIYDKLRRR